MKTAHALALGIGAAFMAVACSAARSSVPTGAAGASGGVGTAGNSGTGGSSGVSSAGMGGGSCATGLSICGSACVDTTSDANNCGGCGIPCGGGHICQASQCLCQTGLLDCSGSCVASDATHCGSCTSACQANEVCSNNACSSGCTGTQTLCGTACVDTTSNSANCGSCGHMCGASQGCMTGTCSDLSMGGAGGGGGAGGAGGTSGAGGSGGGALQLPLVVTSAPNAYWNTSATLTAVTTGTATVTVNDTNVLQSWEGFGGAFNEMGWSYLQMLSQADRDLAMQLLFGSDGAHFNMGRIPIGASDYALARYTDDESANDTSQANFSITQDQKYLIPYVKAAQAVNGSIRFWASPWTPPTWMKTNSGSANGTSCAQYGATPFDGGCMTDSDADLSSLALYFVKWVQAYGQQGITVEAVAPQNEPNYAEGYPSALWTSALFTKFVGKYLGPAFSTVGLSTKIMLGTMSNANTGADPAIVSAVMADATAKSYIQIIGMQWVMKGQVAGAKQYNLPIWQTEHQCGNYPWTPATYKSVAPNDQAYGVESWGLIRDWIKAGVTSYSAWNMVLDTVGNGNDNKRTWAQDSLLVVDTSAKKLILTPAFYVFRHFSQYVKPGAKVVGTSGGDALAFKNPDGSLVAVIYNSGSAGTYTVQIAGKKLQFSMPGTGWATVVAQ